MRNTSERKNLTHSQLHYVIDVNCFLNIFIFLYENKFVQCTGHLVTQENSYSIANINLETIDAVQKITQRQTTATTTMLFHHMRVQLHASTATAAIEGR